jgi:hypothetical protein
MKTINIIFALFFSLSFALANAQVTTADGRTPTNLERPSTLVESEMGAVILEVYDSKELDKINQDIERLLEQREKLIFQMAKEKYPELVSELTQRENQEKDRRSLRNAEKARLKEERRREREEKDNPSGGEG